MDVKEINIVGNKLFIDGKSLDNLPVCSYEMKNGDAEKEIAELTITVHLINTDIKV